MFERFKNKKYSQIAFYVTLILLGVTTFYFLISNLGGIGAFLKKVLNVMSPLIYGFVIAYILLPFMRFCERKILRFRPGSAAEKKLKRPLGVLMSMIFFFVLVTVFLGLIVPQVGRSFMELESQISGYVSAAQNMVDKLIREFPLFNGQYENLSEFLDVNEITTDLKSFISNFYGFLEMGANYVISYAGKFVIEVKNALIGVIVAVYLLLAKEKLVAKCKRLLAAFLSRRHYLNFINLVRFTDKTVGGFILGKLIDSVIIGLLTFLVMSIIGMPFTPLISVIIGLTNIIPFFGPFIGAIPSAFIIFIADPPMTLWFVLMILIIQQLDGNIIGPRILGQSTGLSSLAVLISITVAGGFFGVAGMILGVPAAAVICALVRQKTDSRLRAKNAETDLDYYYTDPPTRDFSREPIFLDKEEKTEDSSET
ncbi:MAG: AI-2E family transporter [Eubacteriales bacterium]